VKWLLLLSSIFQVSVFDRPGSCPIHSHSSFLNEPYAICFFLTVNYADVCIRWGLYESALRYVGWPIVPGFDFSGAVLRAGPSSGYQVGESVFGYSLFGAYSSRLLLPARQMRRVPNVPSPRSGMNLRSTGAVKMSAATIASVPAVAGTALHASMFALNFCYLDCC
jgi:NADPH:quinone reductase-like Zn-dependent oxidoreductase